MKIDIDGLQALARITELGGFRQAAAALHLSQSALSRRIHRLEEGLGVRPLDRTMRRVRLRTVGRLSGNRSLLDFGLPATLLQQRWTYEVQHSF